MIVHSFVHDSVDICSAGRTIDRIAVRAVIEYEGLLLMVHSSVNGDYKFPGGSVDDGESYEETLLREIQMANWRQNEHGPHLAKFNS